jgi:hypothetical protein
VFEFETAARVIDGGAEARWGQRGATTVTPRGGGAEARRVVARGNVHVHGLRLGLGFIGEEQSHEVRTVASRTVGGDVGWQSWLDRSWTRGGLLAGDPPHIRTSLFKNVSKHVFY